MSLLKREIISYLGAGSLAALRGANGESRQFVPRTCEKVEIACTRRCEVSCDICMRLLCRFHVGYVYDEYMREARLCLVCQRQVLRRGGGYVFDGNQ